MPVEKVLSLSTAHISSETNELLDQLGYVNDSEPNPLSFRFVPHHYGFIIFMRSELKEEEDRKRIEDDAPELLPIMDYAIKNNCSMIDIDRDADIMLEFKTFDW